MDEAKLGSVQRLTMKTKFLQQLAVRFSGSAVNRVADQRMADRRHVDADLVGSAGFQPAFDQRRITEDIQPFPVSHRALAAALPSTIAIFLRLAEERASGASTVPWLAFGTPETIAR